MVEDLRHYKVTPEPLSDKARAQITGKTNLTVSDHLNYKQCDDLIELAREAHRKDPSVNIMVTAVAIAYERGFDAGYTARAESSPNH